MHEFEIFFLTLQENSRKNMYFCFMDYAKAFECVDHKELWKILKMPSWMKHKLESRLPGKILITSDMQMTPPLWQKVKRN